jgi:hypothetical protein
MLSWVAIIAGFSGMTGAPLGDTGVTTGSLSLEVSANYASSSDGIRRAEGWLGLSIPLDRFFVPTLHAEPPSARTSMLPAFAEDTSSEREPSADAASEKTEPEPAESESPPAEGAQGATLPPEPAPILTSAVALEAVKRALELADLQALPARLDSLERRSRSSALLPELRLRGARGTDESLRLTPTVTDPYKYTQAGGVDYMLEVRLTWRFDRLVFSSAELGVERLRGQIWHAREAVIERTVKALIAWQKATLVLRDSAADEEARFAAWLTQMEARARLDAMTDGWFSKRVGDATTRAPKK